MPVIVVTYLCEQVAAGAASQQNIDESIKSADIDELTTQLRQARLHRDTTTTGTATGPDTTGTGSDADTAAAASQQDISSNLIISSLAVMKLEKKIRLQKVGIAVSQSALVSLSQ